MTVIIYRNGSYEGNGKLDYGLKYLLSSDITFDQSDDILLRTASHQLFGKFKLKGNNLSGIVELARVS
ncbi:MAG: hypothetical protein ACOZAO_05205 [Patescibacteria group bacterium]